MGGMIRLVLLFVFRLLVVVVFRLHCWYSPVCLGIFLQSGDPHIHLNICPK